MFYRACILIFGITPVFAEERFPDVDLWLPKSYQNIYLKLLDAAEKAQADPYCHRLLSGRLLESRSTLEQPYFHFRCRAEDKTMFSIQVDGVSLVTQNIYGDKQRELEAKRQAELDRLQAEKDAAAAEADADAQAKLKKEQSQYWGICRKAIKKRLQHFEQVQILSKIPPQPAEEDKEFTFIVDFDSKSPSRQLLHYTVSCKISSLDTFEVQIVARK